MSQMLETELFAFLEQTADAAYTVTEHGEICSWNRAAEKLFGYPASEVLGRHIEEVFDAFDSLGTEPLVGGAETAVRHQASGPRIPHFDLDVRTRSGARLWINVSTIVFDNRRTGRRLLVRLARDITQRRLNARLLGRMLELARQVVALPEETSHQVPAEGLTNHEREILTLFADGNSSATIARKLGISAQTLRNNLHHINRKLGTHSRLEAVTHAQRHRLVK
jgi:PAS domain S-box-containing protein